jgi:uncharacterized protein YjiS (DUF1127 family)
MNAITMKQPALVSIKFYGLVRIIDEVAETLQIWKERAEQRRQLRNLNERMMQDIGITRAVVITECNKNIWEA